MRRVHHHRVLSTFLVAVGVAASAQAQCEEAKVLPPTATAKALGAAVSLGNDGTVGQLAVGAPASLSGAGEAFLFTELTPKAWTRVAAVTGTGPGARAGAAVAIFGSDAAIASPGDSLVTGLTSSGVVQVFAQTGGAGSGTWTAGSYLTSPLPGVGYEFGTDVALSGDLLVVGEPDGGTLGLAHVYRKVSNAWLFEATLSPCDGNWSLDADFGRAVDVTSIAAGSQRDAVIVGGPDNDDGAIDAGKVCIFVLKSGVWSQDSFVSVQRPFANTGFSVAIDRNDAVIGAPGVNGTGSAPDGGAALYLTWNGTNYDHAGHWLSPNAGDRLGTSVDLARGDSVLGVPGYDRVDGSGKDCGAIWLIRKGAGGWDSPSSNLFQYPLDVTNGDVYGGAVAVQGGRAAVGAPEQDATGSDSGAVYVVDLKPSTWQWSFGLGGAAKGTTGFPDLIGEGSLCPGQMIHLKLSNALPGTAGWLVIGFSYSGSPFLDGVLIPKSDVTIAWPTTTSPTGTIVAPIQVPADFAGGTPTWFQWIVADSGAAHGYSMSNGIQGTTP